MKTIFSTILLFVACTGFAQEIAVIKIKHQIWMTENVCTETGNFSSVVLDSSDMIQHYVYDWNSAKMACPEGFRLPTDSEWDTLTVALGGTKKAGTALKQTGPGTFNAVLGGNYSPGLGFFNYLNDYGYYWTSDEFSKTSAWARVLGAHQSNINRTTIAKTYYLSVRCIKAD